MKMITMKSVIKSDKECMPSAIMALLRPHMPAMIFAADKMRLVKKPTQVTRAAFFSQLHSRDVIFSVHNGVMFSVQM